MRPCRTRVVPRELQGAPNGLTPLVHRTPDVIRYDRRSGHPLGKSGITISLRIALKIGVDTWVEPDGTATDAKPLAFAPTFNVLHPICGFSRLTRVNNEAAAVSDLIRTIPKRGAHRLRCRWEISEPPEPTLTVESRHGLPEQLHRSTHQHGVRWRRLQSIRGATYRQ